MSRIEEGFQGQPAVHLSTPGGDRATVLLHGAQVISWIPAGGTEQLYRSERSAYGPGATVRGGVPVVFPQFNKRGPDFDLPKHGIVRTRDWRLDPEQAASAASASDLSSVRLVLGDDDATRALWPHGFHLALTVGLDAGRLDLALSVRNRGPGRMAFTAALHSYLRVDDIGKVRVSGLQGVRYLDTVVNVGSVGAQPDLAIDKETDRIYFEVPGPLSLLAPERRLEVAMEGFRDAVVWNPWSDLCATLPDMPDDGYRRMLCIEAAVIDKPVMLEVDETWRGRQILTAHPSTT